MASHYRIRKSLKICENQFELHKISGIRENSVKKTLKERGTYRTANIRSK